MSVLVLSLQEKCEETIECVSEMWDLGCGAPLADVPEGSYGLGGDFLPSAWMISVLTHVLMRTVWSQWAFRRRLFSVLFTKFLSFQKAAFPVEEQRLNRKEGLLHFGGIDKGICVRVFG